MTNGRPAGAGEYAAVIFLFNEKENGLGEVCTGVFIDPVTVLTAAHCTTGPLGVADAAGRVYKTLSLIRKGDDGRAFRIAESLRVTRHPRADDQWTTDARGFEVSDVNPMDLALVTFPAGQAPAVATLAPRSPEVGDHLTLVGFGLDQTHDRSERSSIGVKRIGVNRVTGISGGRIHMVGLDRSHDHSGTDVAAAPGDSGGPAFYNGRVAGIVSGGTPVNRQRNQSIMVDLNSDLSRQFLRNYR